MTLLERLKKSTLFHIYYFAVFVISGLLVNALQVVTLLCWPFSKSLYRLVNAYLIYFLWAQLVFLVTTYSGSEIFIHCDERFSTAMTQDHALLLMNHIVDLDWMAAFCVAEIYGQLFSAKCFLKSDLKYVPLIGWGFYLLEMPFLKRDFVQDREQIVEAVKMITEFPMPAKLCLFSEGTRFTPEKYEKSKKFALEKGLPVLKHHLMPRTKGFCIAIEGLKARVPSIIDITAGIEDNGEGVKCTVFDLLKGKKVTFHGYIKVRAMDEVPSGSEKEMSDYLHALYQEKDKAMDYFYKHNTFYGFDNSVKQHYMAPRIQPTLVMIFWHLLFGIPTLYYLCFLLWSGSVVTISVSVLVALFLQMLLQQMSLLTDTSHASAYGSHQRVGVKEEMDEEVTIPKRIPSASSCQD